ncbi:GNAT family N-acetyltransferase [Nisaea acidiphila]|uniref:GNAT family N-acetyltransferase n=1 Tax=Nisaea acidiphila TaxID=1862145 RepID=A0A9J7AXM5_9PROT|nr:GNAT family N-acetyltransferase [Nisaea acidiphila]UUX51822.1 GNAT family N-acetyltransferase [Nisaea acidiphila]
MTEIRAYDPARDDLTEIVALVHRAFGEYRGKLMPESGALSETVESLGKRLEKNRLFLAEQDGKLCGAVFAARKRDAIYLDRLAVDSTARGRGIARSLINAVEEHARESGTSRVTLGVRLALTGNIAYFQRQGFVETGRQAHAGFDAPTSMDMEKRL